MGIERVPDGEDVVAFLEGLGDRGAWVAGAGNVADAVVSSAADPGETTRVLSSPAQLVSLSGPLEGPVMVVLATADGLVAGRLMSARSAGVALFLNGSAGPPVAAAQPVARAKPAPVEDDESEEAPRYGDRVDHFVFGLCDVMVVREERMKIRDVTGGRLREIHLGAVKVLPPTVIDGRRVFKLARK